MDDNFKKPGDLLSSIDQKLQSIPKITVESKLSPEAIRLVNEIFIVLEQHIKYFRLNKMNNHEAHLLSKREWAKTFDANNLTEDEVRAGGMAIRLSKESYDDLMPGEFVRLCRGASKLTSAAHKDFIALPAMSETSRAIGIEHLRKLKQMLKG